MNQEQVRNIFLKALYEVWANGQQLVSLREVAQEHGISRLDLEKVVKTMEDQGLIGDPHSDWHFRSTGKGLLLAEKEKLIAKEICIANVKIRTKVLEALAKAYDEEGPYADVNIDDLLVASNVDFEELQPNLYLLADIGYVRGTTLRAFKITEVGLESVLEWRHKVALSSKFDEISSLPPQTRGRHFQKLLARIIESHGWSQEEGLRTSNEEMDIVVFQSREYYLVECKWEKESIEAAVIRELSGKLDNRIGVRGIVASVSGFTDGAVKQVEDYSGQKIILLFGPEDIKILVSQTKSFDDLLDQKYKELVTKRKAIFR